MLTAKSSNRSSILQCVRREPISRVDISKQTNLSKSAVTTLTNEMMQKGLLQEIGVAGKPSSVGRKPTLLDIVPDYRFAVGVGLHRKRIAVSLVNLKLEQIDKVGTDTSTFSYPDLAVEWICNQVQTLVDKHDLDWSKCTGIGVSSPGPLDYKTGVIFRPPDFELFTSYPIVKRLQSLLNGHVSLENNSVLLAATDYLWNSLSQYSQIMFISMWEGIGTAILSNGEIMRGYAGFMGELGHCSVDINGIQCTCGNRGCLEQYVSAAALRQRFSFSSYEKLVDDAYNGLPYALNILSFLSEYLGCAIVNAVNILDLDAVVIFGEFNYRPGLLFERIKNIVQTRSVVCHSHKVDILASCISLEDMDISNAVGVINDFFAGNGNA